MAVIIREHSEGNLYHVFTRGVGRRLLFEDSSDCDFFKGLLSDFKGKNIQLYAWCLMDNHIHLLLHGDLDDVAAYMLRLETKYARYFNSKYGHVGHVFQGRYGSQPIGSDDHLKAAIRYVHLNPVKAGICTSPQSYPWSSYAEYLSSSGPSDRDFVLAVFGGMQAFASFHSARAEVDNEGFLDDNASRPDTTYRFASDSVALAAARRVLHGEWNEAVHASDKRTTDGNLLLLRSEGLSIRQIERITGIGRGIIARVK